MLPEGEASPAELVETVNSRADSIRGVKAALDLSFRRSPGDEAKGCRGRLISFRGDRRGPGTEIYLKGYRRLMPTFFTLTSDGNSFWLHIPGENTVYTGPLDRTEHADTAEVDMQASDLARALFVEPFDSAAVSGIIEEAGQYVLSLARDGTLWRRLWIDKRIFAVVGEKYYNSRGGVELELRRSRHALAGGTYYPLDIEILRPGSGSEISLVIRELLLNPEPVPPRVFEFEAPPGTKKIRLDRETER
jgi:hypothetical protein